METWTQTSSCGCDYTPSTTTAAPQAQHELNNYSPRVTDTEDVDSNVSSISIPLGSQYTQDSVPDGFYSVIDTASSLSESHEGNASSDELVGRSPAGSPCGDHNHNTSFVSADSRTDAMAERPLSPVSVVAPWSVTAWEGGRALQHYTPTLGIGSEWNNPFGKYLPQQTSDLTGTRGWKCLHPDDRVAYSAVNNLLTQSVDKDFISSFWRDHNRSSVSQQRLLTGQSSSTRGRWPHSSVSAGPLTAGTSRTQNCPRKGKYFGRPCDACNHRLRQQWTKCQQIQDYDGGSSEKQGLYLLDLSSKTPSMENVQVQHPMHKVSSPNRGLPKLASLKKELTDPQFYDRHKDGSKAPSFYIGSPYHRDRFFFGYKRSMLTLDMKEAELQTLEQTRQREILLADRLGPKQVMHQRPWSVVRSPHMLEHVRKGRKILEASQDTSKLLKNYNQLMDSILHYEIPGVKSMRDNYAVLFNRQSCESLDDDLLSSSVSSDSNNTSRRFPALYTPQQPDNISTHILADQQQTSL